MRSERYNTFHTEQMYVFASSSDSHHPSQINTTAGYKNLFFFFFLRVHEAILAERNEEASPCLLSQI